MGLAFNIFTAAFCAIGSFLFGYDSGIIASVLTMPQFNDHFKNPDDKTTGAVVSTFNGGCFFGAATGGWLNDRLGRKRSIQIGALIGLVGAALQTAAPDVGVLFLGRIVGGFSIGLLSMTVPLYNTEIAPPHIRGFIVGLSQQMIGIGFIVANWVGYGLQFVEGNAAWRAALGLQMVPTFLLLFIQFLPYSPRWLLEVGRDDEARAIVYRLHGTGTVERKDAAEREFVDMRDTIKAEVAVRSSRISDLWASKAMVWRTSVAVGVQVFGQFTGINVINYYGPKMYAALGIKAGSLLLIQGIFGAIGPVANIFFIVFLIDRVGRRRPLLFGCAALVVLFSILAAIIARFPPDASFNPSAQKAGIAVIFMMTIVFSLSFGPISWVLASEVFPTSTRSMGTAVATCSNWAFNVMLSEVSPIAMANIGWKFYLLFICLNTVDFGIVFAVFPETKGKTLEQMAEVFRDTVVEPPSLRSPTADKDGDGHSLHYVDKV